MTGSSDRSGRLAPLATKTSNLLRLQSATWLYPLSGIIYFLSHRFLWPLFRGRLLPIVLLSTLIYFLLFFFTYLPQVAFLAIFQYSTAWFNGAFLVLGEGAAIVALLFEAFFVDETQVDVFDAVLLREADAEDLISQSRMLRLPSEDANGDDGEGSVGMALRDNSGKYKNPVKLLGKPTTSVEYAPFSFRQIIEFVILLPLNFIPVAGTPLFLVLTGYRAGPFHHWRYFQLLDFSKEERKAFVARRRLRYTWFGTVGLILQLVPILSMFFLLTSAAGAALWAADMERRRRAAEEGHQRQQPPDAYRDDPTAP